MKKVVLIFCLLLGCIPFSVGAEVVTGEFAPAEPSPIGQAANPNTVIPYGQSGELGLQQGITAVGNVGGLKQEEGLSEFVQKIVVYILSFVSLIAVLYIIYAGFQILIGNGEEEKLKKSKQTILYVVLGIVVIWLAWPITTFVISALS